MNNFGSGVEDEILSGKEYLLDLILTLEEDRFLLARTLLGEDVEVVDIDDTLVFAGDGGVDMSKSRSVDLGLGSVSCVGPVLLNL